MAVFSLVPGALLFPGAELLGKAAAGACGARCRAGSDPASATFHQPVPLARCALDLHLVEIEAIGPQGLGDAIALCPVATPADDDLAGSTGRTAHRCVDRRLEAGRRRWSLGGQQQRQQDQRMLCPVLAQSAMKPWIPFSVSGWLNSARMTEAGAVMTSAPIFADSSTWIGWRTLATRISVPKS